MTPNDFFAQIAQFTSTGIITLSPGPFEIRIDKADIYAAKLIEGLYEDFTDRSVKDLGTHLLNGVLIRMHDLSDGSDILVDDEFDLWKDEQIQTLLMAWWWMMFFTAQSVESDKTELDKGGI